MKLKILIPFLSAFFFLPQTCFGVSSYSIHPYGLLTPGMSEGLSDNLVVRGLSGACLAISHIIDDLPCHPAFVPLNTTPSLTASLVLSEGYDYIDLTRKITENGKDAFVASKVLIEGSQPSNVELLGKISFISPYFNAQYSPSHIQFYSNVQGDVNPDVQLFLLRTEYLLLQWGMELTSYLSVGIQSWIGQGEIIHRNFSLLDLGTDVGKDYLRTNKIKFNLLEPGIVLHPFDRKIQLAIKVRKASNDTPVEIQDPKNTTVDTGLSYSVMNDIRTGRLTLLADYRSQLLRLGVKYDYGVLSVLAGAHQYSYSYGILFFIKKMYSGIVFSKSRSSGSSLKPEETVYTAFGVQI